ncbi:MAG: hypothetical protein ACXAD7_09500 [Candidatus Kariarchaeaceae archaeon]
MPKAKSSREERSATTFWMDKALKEIAQEKATSIDMTLTDLINRAVDFYLREGHNLDEEKDEKGRTIGQKFAMVELAQELKESGKFEIALAEISQIQRGLQARLSEIETGEFLQRNIQAHISAKVDPFLEQLGELLVRLNPNLE